MKVDKDYLKKLVLSFYESPKISLTIDDLKSEGFDFESDQFKHHMLILNDKNFIASLNGTPGFGLNNRGGWTTTQLRLTSDGQDFAEAIKNETVWRMINEKFSSAGIEVLVTAAKEGLKYAVQETVKGFFR